MAFDTISIKFTDIPCDKCNGTGKIRENIFKKVDCKKCDGTGTVNKTFTTAGIKLGLVKRITEIQTSIKDENSLDNIDKIKELLVCIFNNQFSLDDVDKYMSINELKNVFEIINGKNV